MGVLFDVAHCAGILGSVAIRPNGMDAPTSNGIEMCQRGDAISSTSTDRSVHPIGPS